MTFYFIGYRQWSIDVFKSLKSIFPRLEIVLLSDFPTMPLAKHFNPNTDTFIFVGWSHIVDSEFVSRFRCFCIHPSPLPRYRGGSPIQNQIINGEHSSAVTLFKMDSGCDSGPIFHSYQISLDGYLSEVLDRIMAASLTLLSALVLQLSQGSSLKLIPQDESIATHFTRRQPADSSFSLSDFVKLSANEVYNHVRCLQPPYPPFQIVYPDGKRLTILKVYVS